MQGYDALFHRHLVTQKTKTTHKNELAEAQKMLLMEQLVITNIALEESADEGLHMSSRMQLDGKSVSSRIRIAFEVLA